MKKLLIFGALIIAFATNAQKVTVTTTGIKSESDVTKDYVVIDAPNKTAADLYNNILKYIQKTYKNPDAVLKGKVENDYFRFETYKPSAVLAKAGMSKAVFSVKFVTQIDFKDGKAKVTFNNIEYIGPSESAIPLHLHYQGGAFDGYVIYNKKGEVKDQSAKTQIEDYFNGQILELSNALNGVDASKEGW